MPPNSHIPIIPTPPTPCDWGPAQGQGPGPGPGPGPGVGGWGTWGGGGGDNGNVATKRLSFERLSFETGLSFVYWVLCIVYGVLCIVYISFGAFQSLGFFRWFLLEHLALYAL